MVKTVIGSFDSYDEAQRVVRDLKDEGFMENDISIVASNVGGRYETTNPPVTAPVASALTMVDMGNDLPGWNGLFGLYRRQGAATRRKAEPYVSLPPAFRLRLDR